MAELERIASHLADLRDAAGAAGLGVPEGRFGLHREAVLAVCGAAFGHRLMMDCTVPGGVAADLAAAGAAAVLAMLGELDAALPALRRAAEPVAAAGRGLGVTTPALVARLAAGGPIGRAAGRGFDVRCMAGQGGPAVEPAVLAEGDGEARLRVRLAELGASIGLARGLLESLPGGAISLTLPAASGEGIGCAEGARGDVWHWLRLDGGQIGSVFMRDPAWLHWPLLEAAMAGGDVDEVLAGLASFGCPVSGVDL
jgi:Ni,Fe-hydrogenase III large subunit